MLKRGDEDELLPELLPVIEGMGYSIVECKSRKVGRSFQVRLIIYSPQGISVESCSDVYKTVLPRIELIADSKDINLEVSSPGISRTIKSTREFTIFKGRDVRIMLEGSSTWRNGTISDTGDDWVSIKTPNGEENIAFNSIVKAKLGYSEEVR